MIVALVVALADMDVGAALGYGPLLRYKSEGVLSMEMGTAEYERFAELDLDANTARRFVAISFPAGMDSQRIDQMISNVTKGIWPKPLPKVSKADAKELPDGVLQIDKDKAQAVYLGLRLTQTAANLDEIAKCATWLGAYFKDVATREALRDWVSR